MLLPFSSILPAPVLPPHKYFCFSLPFFSLFFLLPFSLLCDGSSLLFCLPFLFCKTAYPEHLGVGFRSSPFTLTDWRYYSGFGLCPFKHPSEGNETPFWPDLSFYQQPAHFLFGLPKAMAKAVQVPGAAEAELQGKIWLKYCLWKKHLHGCAQPPPPGNVTDCIWASGVCASACASAGVGFRGLGQAR